MQRSNPEIEKKYNSIRWRKLRKQKILLNPYCERCICDEIYNATYIVHHKEYINQSNYLDDNIFYNIDNLECLCLECHNKEHFKKKQNYFFDKEGNIVYKNDINR